MGTVNDAFENLRKAGEITQTDQHRAQSRHARIRAALEDRWDIDRTFLTGSYDRHTKIKPLQDVDIFAVIEPDGAQGGYRDRPPADVVNAMATVLDGLFTGVTVDGSAVVIAMSDDEGEATFELVAAFDHAQGGFEIPDPDNGRWIRTDPLAHADLTSAKNNACDGKWVPFVKMIKAWNAEAGRPVPQSFLIEVMALDLVKPPFGRYPDEVATFLGNIADHADGPWPDPAHLGPALDESFTSTHRQTIRDAARAAMMTAEEAIYLQDQGKESAAVEEWRKLFGNRMPRPT